MAKRYYFIFMLIVSLPLSWGATILPMNKAYNALTELLPFLTDENKFMEKKNAPYILERLTTMEEAFKTAKHEELLKQDIFAPSLALLSESLQSSRRAFSESKKDYALWKVKDITARCLDCHTRLPADHSSSFQDGAKQLDQSQFSSPYQLGMAQMIVRLWPEAKVSFTRVIDEGFLKKDFKETISALKQILVIETKVMRDPQRMLTQLQHYESKKNLPQSDRKLLKIWIERLKVLAKSSYAKGKIESDGQFISFILKTMKPLFRNDSLYIGNFDPDLLFASGLISNYLFENPNSKHAAEGLYWVGLSEKYLRRDNFFGSGDLMLRECVVRYPKNPIAKKCFNEYKESVEFEFTGSRGTDIPDEVQLELDKLEKSMESKTKP